MAKFSLTLDMDIDLPADVTPAQLNQVMKERLTEHMTSTFLTGFTGAKLRRYVLNVKHRLPVPKILTLSQLVEMPVGTVVSPVKMRDGVRADFDIQGVLQLGGEAQVMSKDHWLINLRPLRKDIKVRDGRVVTTDGDFGFCHPNPDYPKRFVLWEE